jgi:hypothetical protein
MITAVRVVYNINQLICWGGNVRLCDFKMQCFNALAICIPYLLEVQLFQKH